MDKGGDWQGYLDAIAKEHAPIARFATAEELANFFVFLCSDRASYSVDQPTSLMAACSKSSPEPPSQDKTKTSPQLMNPIGIHFGYWTQYWDVDQLPFVEKARKTGFDVLEVRAQKIARMSKAELDALKGAAADAGLEPTYSIGMTEDMDLVSEDVSVRKNGVTLLQNLCRNMKHMGGR